jgi:hypothetical protein
MQVSLDSQAPRDRQSVGGRGIGHGSAAPQRRSSVLFEGAAVEAGEIKRFCRFSGHWCCSSRILDTLQELSVWVVLDRRTVRKQSRFPRIEERHFDAGKIFHVPGHQRQIMLKGGRCNHPVDVGQRDCLEISAKVRTLAKRDSSAVDFNQRSTCRPGFPVRANSERTFVSSRKPVTNRRALDNPFASPDSVRNRRKEAA